MRIKAGTRAFVENAPASALTAIGLPSLDVHETLTGTFGSLHLFVVTEADMDDRFPKLRLVGGKRTDRKRGAGGNPPPPAPAPPTARTRAMVRGTRRRVGVLLTVRTLPTALAC